MTAVNGMEKSPSPVYGARLELVYGLIAHRGFESLLLRQHKNRAWSLLLQALILYRSSVHGVSAAALIKAFSLSEIN